MDGAVTAGQIAYEAYMKAWGNPSRWNEINEAVKEKWEAVAQAVQAFYETGIPGAR